MRRLLVAGAICLLLALLLLFSTTSAGPSISPPPAPDAESVAAGRDAYRQLRQAQGSSGGATVGFSTAQLAGVSAVVSHGFRPDRLSIGVERGHVVARFSHPIQGLGRWLNIAITAEGSGQGFPPARIRVGSWDLPPTISRLVLQAARLAASKHLGLPPLDTMVRDFRVDGTRVTARISLPGKSSLVDRIAGAIVEPVDRASVLLVYCTLQTLQPQRPSLDFAEQIRRAFTIAPAGVDRADFNRAVFVAFGMFAVDEGVGDFAQLTPSNLGKCRRAAVFTSIYGRQDWPRHWALSAAIAVGAGAQLSEAAGEWKELADSLSRQSQFAIGDPTGFSMADLAADRAGFRIARAAWQPGDAGRMAAALSKASAEQLLPPELVRHEDAFTNATFVKRYGGLDDPRFKQKVREIDGVLDVKALH